MKLRKRSIKLVPQDNWSSVYLETIIFSITFGAISSAEITYSTFKVEYDMVSNCVFSTLLCVFTTVIWVITYWPKSL